MLKPKQILRVAIVATLLALSFVAAAFAQSTNIGAPGYFAPASTGGGDAGTVNVLDYGATGAARMVTDAVSTNLSQTVTSATAAFSSARDVGKLVWGAKQTGGPSGVALSVPLGTITAVNSATSIQVSVAAVASNTTIALTWGTDDTDALKAAFAAAFNSADPGKKKPTIYLPAGIYIIDELLGDWRSNTSLDSNPKILGAGSRATTFVYKPDYNTGTTFGDGTIVATASGNASSHFEGFTITGGSFQWPSGMRWAIQLTGRDSSIKDVILHHIQSISGWNLGLFVNSCGDLDGGSRCLIHNVTIYAVGASGGGYGFLSQSSKIEIQNFNYWEVFLISIGNSTDAVILGSAFSDTSGLVIEGGANVRMFGSRVRFTLFVNGANTRVFCSGCVIDDVDSVTNQHGVSIGAGATFSYMASRIVSWGTGLWLTNAGTAIDLGGNIYVAGTGSGGFGTAAPYGSAKAHLAAILPTCDSTAEGYRNPVTDSNTATWGATVAGSSTNHVLAYCNGTNWTVAGK